MQTPHWRSLSPADLEREYSPSSAIGGNYQPFTAQYAARSAHARGQFLSLLRGQAHWALPYGAAGTAGGAPSQTMDLFVPTRKVATAKPPLLVFIHGGYWQALSKNDSQFAALDCTAQGWAHAVLDYTLAPAASVADIVEECRQALAYLTAQADALGFDARRIVLAGSSAGAHLAAMTALGAPRGAVAGVVLVSGIFELEPLVGTSINAALGLTAQSARSASPQCATAADLAHFPPALLAYGSVETAQFKRQSSDFAALLAAHGGKPRVLEVPLRNHFDVVLELGTAGTPLGDAVIGLMASV